VEGDICPALGSGSLLAGSGGGGVGGGDGVGSSEHMFVSHQLNDLCRRAGPPLRRARTPCTTCQRSPASLLHTRGPRRKPGASSYTLTRLSLSFLHTPRTRALPHVPPARRLRSPVAPLPLPPRPHRPPPCCFAILLIRTMDIFSSSPRPRASQASQIRQHTTRTSDPWWALAADQHPGGWPQEPLLLR